MGIVAAMVLPGRLTAGDGIELRAATNAIAGGLERTRSLALTSGEEAVFALDVEHHRFQVPGDRQAENLPPQARLALHAASGDVMSDSAGGIRFFPDGGSTGGGISIAQGGHSYRISVNWLTGRVEVRDDS